ncbi:MAG TPA: aminopeptidase [Desulfobulbaceae bacterium]|nr:aminopeptidase [Desulfobulbaceae bacterium]
MPTLPPEAKPDCRADPERLREWVAYLAGTIGCRPATRPDLLQAVADRLASAFQELGFAVTRQPVPWRTTSHANIIAAPGESQLADPSCPLLIVGAHYDTVSRSPGADDNGSGVAGLMEMARLLAGEPPPGLRLVAFCPEEPPAYRTSNMGSYHYAHSLKKAKSPVLGMICLEMIGFFSDAPGSQSYPLPFMNILYPDRGDFIAMVGNLRSAPWTRKVRNAFAAATDLPVETLNGPALIVGIDFSDHWSFNKFGYPAVMVTDTAFYRNPQYHKPSDTPDTLDYERAAKVVTGLAAAVRKVAAP